PSAAAGRADRVACCADSLVGAETVATSRAEGAVAAAGSGLPWAAGAEAGRLASAEGAGPDPAPSSRFAGSVAPAADGGMSRDAACEGSVAPASGSRAAMGSGAPGDCDAGAEALEPAPAWPACHSSGPKNQAAATAPATAIAKIPR